MPLCVCILLSLQTLCFASGANETAHVAKVVARQRSSKKTGRPHLVNTHMRVKPAAPLVLNGRIFGHGWSWLTCSFLRWCWLSYQPCICTNMYISIYFYWTQFFICKIYDIYLSVLPKRRKKRKLSKLKYLEICGRACFLGQKCNIPNVLSLKQIYFKFIHSALNKMREMYITLHTHCTYLNISYSYDTYEVRAGLFCPLFPCNI